MILRTIITALVLLTAYNIFVVYFAPRWWSATQNHSQSNLLSAQNFTYDESDSIQNIILGSSLAKNIVADSLPYTYNLAFAGKGVLDGLNILDKSAKIPKNIFIETNFIVKRPSSEFTDLINNPVMYYPRKHLPSLREDKQPMVIFGLIQINVLSAIKNFILGKNKSIAPAESKKDEKSPLFSQYIKMRIKNYSEMPKASDVKESLEELEYFISRLEERGANIIFIEMPIERQLNVLPQTKFVRDMMKSNFPVSKYQYLIPPDSMTFQTVDGIHLGKHEALRYTMYLKSSVENMLTR